MLTLADARAAYACPLLPLAERPDVPGRYRVTVRAPGCLPLVCHVTARDRNDAAERAVDLAQRHEGLHMPRHTLACDVFLMTPDHQPATRAEG